MKGSDRLRRLASYAIIAALVIVAVSCNEAHPNTTLEPKSDLGREIDLLWDRLLLLGTIVFVLVEAGLIYIVFKYRHRENQGTPPQTHGSTKLEITWTLIPAVILVFIAVPTVRTIFITQAHAAPGSLNIDVTGHQWWWEFRYPEYGVTTANEIYIPVGRTVNFRLRSADVLHSFWTPQLGGKRDVITNRTNYIWYTPDSSTASNVWNGFCAEYCGASHANMRFRVFTVTPAQFESWVAGQKLPARFGAVGPAAPTGGPIPPPLEGGIVTTPGGTNAPSRRRKLRRRELRSAAREPAPLAGRNRPFPGRRILKPIPAHAREPRVSLRRRPTSHRHQALWRPATYFRASRFRITPCRMPPFRRDSSSRAALPGTQAAASRSSPAPRASGVMRSPETRRRWA